MCSAYTMSERARHLGMQHLAEKPGDYGSLPQFTICSELPKTRGNQ
jgi:hypothetical protein